MIPPAGIVDYLSAASHGALPLSILWHVALASLLVGLKAGWRPQTRTFGIVLAAPLLSVAAVAAAFTNPFNTVLFLAAGSATPTRHPSAVFHVQRLPWRRVCCFSSVICRALSR